MKNIYLITLILLSVLWGCKKEADNPENPFVGGPENPASDGTYTSRIYSENGIASLEEITLGGEKQWILIRGYDVSKPVLIFLHGGPGSACLFYSTYAMKDVEKDFVVVSWDQRGSGKSYHENTDPGTLTFDQLYSDMHELISKMKARFGVDKVYLMGISWGSVLGIRIAQEHPELLHAWIGVSQVVNVAEGLELAYEAVLSKANELNNEEAIAELSAITTDSTWQYKDIISKWVDAFGFGDWHDAQQANEVLQTLASNLTEYTDKDIANLDKGRLLYSLSPLGSDLEWLRQINMKEEIPQIEVPVYFLAGNYDYKTPAQLVDEYFQMLNAPAGKEIYRFNNSAHVPILEEQETFRDVMKDIVK